MYDVIIIGAGASGLVSAIVSARRGKKVLILEKNAKVGKKLLATGNGRCNITNQKPTPNRFHSKNRYFIEQVLEGYNYQSIKKFFHSIGLQLVEGKEGKVFPMSLQASSVVEILQATCEELGVEICCECEVKEIVHQKNSYQIKHSQGLSHGASLIIATGHCSAPSLGGVDGGVVFAKKFGHKIVDASPSLVQLTSPMKNLKQLSGVKIDSKVTCGEIQKQGDVLFTSYGISGLAILDISRVVVEKLKKSKTIELEIDLMPKMSSEQLIGLMRKNIRKKSIRGLELWLQSFIHKKLIDAILEPLKLPTLIESQITLQEIEKIVHAIKSFKFIVDGSRGYKGAEVATGGVNTKEINPKTMESTKSKGLYFTGEVLDVDGDRGGFNLHFAWVCGMRAGDCV